MTLDVDLGFHQWRMGVSVRLAGLDAPELRGADREAGIVARDFIRAACPTGTPIILESIRDRTEEYGRILGRLRLADGRCLNDLLLEKGLARRGRPLPFKSAFKGGVKGPPNKPILGPERKLLWCKYCCQTEQILVSSHTHRVFRHCGDPGISHTILTTSIFSSR